MYFGQSLCHRVFDDIDRSAYTGIYHFIIFDLLFAKSTCRIFYKNNMILWFILSDPAKSGLGSGALIKGYNDQNKDTQKHYHYIKISVIFQCSVSEQNPCDSTACFFCHLGHHLEYFTTLKHNNNNNNNNNNMSVKFSECNCC